MVKCSWGTQSYIVAPGQFHIFISPLESLSVPLPKRTCSDHETPEPLVCTPGILRQRWRAFAMASM